MDRMARDTKQPEVLRELFETLGNDPAVIAECLARPVLTERLIADLSAQDQTRRAESPDTDGSVQLSRVTTSGQVAYTLPTIAEIDDPLCTEYVDGHQHHKCPHWPMAITPQSGPALK